MPNTQTRYYIALASIILCSVAISIRLWDTTRDRKYQAELMGIEIEVILHKDRHDGNQLHLLARNETADDLTPSILTRTIETTNRTNEKFYIISSQGVPNAHPANRKRLDSFVQAWNATCGQPPHVEICPGIVDTRQGYGLTAA